MTTQQAIKYFRKKKSIMPFISTDIKLIDSNLQNQIILLYNKTKQQADERIKQYNKRQRYRKSDDIQSLEQDARYLDGERRQISDQIWNYIQICQQLNKKVNQKLIQIIIRQAPHVIQYIKNPSQKMKMLAVKVRKHNQIWGIE